MKLWNMAVAASMMDDPRRQAVEQSA